MFATTLPPDFVGSTTQPSCGPKTSEWHRPDLPPPTSPLAPPALAYGQHSKTMRGRGLLRRGTGLTPPRDGEEVIEKVVRFRTVGDITCTCPVDSQATTAAEIVIETLAADVSERGATRMDDKTSDASMEKRKKDGYF